MTRDSNDSTEVERLDRAHVFGTWTKQQAYSPREVVEADGATITTADGEEYIDFSSQLVCVNLGHSADRVAEAIAEQARSVPFVRSGYATAARARLGAKLAEVTPGALTKSFFSTGGAMAVEAAIKIAQAYTGKPKILSRYRSYHGATAGTMPVTGDPRRLWNEMGSQNVIRVPDPFAYGSRIDPMVSLDVIEEALLHEGDTVAAVIVEPIVGSSGGVIVPPEGYLSRLQELAHQHGALLIADEVMTGFGRTGEWFACDHFEIEPDVLTLAKGLTGSYAPLGATVVTKEIADYFEDEPFAHGHTFSGHPVACAAGLAAIETYAEDKLIERAREVGTYLEECLSDLAQAHPSVGDFRGIGLFYGLELSRRSDRRAPFVSRLDEFSTSESVMDRVVRRAAERGISLFARFNTIMVAPPLTISTEEIDQAIAALDVALEISDEEMDE